jgi:MazG family protein
VDAPQAEIPRPAPSSGGVLDRALALVEFLRARCDWDAEQTPRTLRRYLIEEAHEVIDAIDAADPELLQEELGDLLLNIAFQIVIAEESGAFDRERVVQGLEAKMARRHPHLYGGGDAEAWDSIKMRERREPRDSGSGTILGDLTPAADPLRHAHRVQERVARVGFDWPEASGALEKVREEVDEVGAELSGGPSLRLEEEVGDLLFSVVNLARLAGVDSPTALARANAKFTRRFVALEMLAGERGVVLGEAGLDQLDLLWEEAKRQRR